MTAAATQNTAVIETPRVVLRRLTLDDLDDLAALYADPVVMRYYPAIRTREETERNLRWIIEQYDVRPGTGLWATVHKAESRFLGRCGLLPQPTGDNNADELEVGYMFHQAAWGQGYATEAARAIRDHAFRAFPGEPRVISLIRPENRPSERVAERNAMRPVRDILHAGLAHRVWAVERSAWQSLAPGS